jgi:hypothetical protein
MLPRQTVRNISPQKTKTQSGFVQQYNFNSDIRIFDSYLPTYFHHSDINKNIEYGIQLAHKGLTQKDDDVVIVGGGMGVTAALAAKHVGKGGHVTIYEPFDRLKEISKNMSINEVDPDVRVHRKLVYPTETDEFTGQAKINDHIRKRLSEDYGGEFEVADPRDLPECDVLELDCEGAELAIIENLDIRPRVIILELECYAYKSFYDNKRTPDEVLDCLSEMGYQIVQHTGHLGTPIASKQIKEQIDIKYELGHNGAGKETRGNIKHSPVISAIRRDCD